MPADTLAAVVLKNYRLAAAPAAHGCLEGEGLCLLASAPLIFLRTPALFRWLLLVWVVLCLFQRQPHILDA